MINSTHISYIIAVLTTLAYCVLAWYLGNLFVTLVGVETLNDLPRISQIAIVPIDADLDFNMIHWQLITVASLALHFFWRQKPAGSSNGISIASHYGVLLLLFFLHLIGFAASFTAVAYVLE